REARTAAADHPDPQSPTLQALLRESALGHLDGLGGQLERRAVRGNGRADLGDLLHGRVSPRLKKSVAVNVRDGTHGGGASQGTSRVSDSPKLELAHCFCLLGAAEFAWRSRRDTSSS